jgi:hypothetical protein
VLFTATLVYAASVIIPIDGHPYASALLGLGVALVIVAAKPVCVTRR